MILSEDEVETLKKLIRDWGFEYSLEAECAKVVALADRLGMKEWADLYRD